MAFLRSSGGFSGSGDGEIGVENLVEESRVGEARWVAEGERGGRGFDNVRVEVLGLVTKRKEREREKKRGTRAGEMEERGERERREERGEREREIFMISW